ncbi:aspartic peptidase domain-containing protein [Kickxella alabastrina]|uniref:aspartic peptidase domain-containing protein n=1 Tax=Kickxella alabastrina TaxID=61397 RepID=UPI0022203296|nr:aspartic peptidase domain-containing protein [Kickxella alabastrina]KAI7834958.1 aspartic peptidase domain-containing protein [Kickxella alabastrina]
MMLSVTLAAPQSVFSGMSLQELETPAAPILNGLPISGMQFLEDNIEDHMSTQQVPQHDNENDDDDDNSNTQPDNSLAVVPNMQGGNGSFKIPITPHRSHGNRVSTMAARVRALQKHMLNVPGKWLQVVEKLPYYGEVGVGTPPQLFKLDLDTGSGDVWLAGQECTVCSRHKKFNPKRSSTYKAEGRKWGISYGDGSFASGYTIRDTVTIGNLTVPNQVVGLATNESRAYQIDIVDGLLGLAYSGVSFIPGVTTFLDNILENDYLAEPIFSVYITEKDKNDYAGEYLFGAIDKTRYSGELTWVPLHKPKFWEVMLDDVSLNFDSFTKMGLDIKGSAIIDTGTTLIVMSDDQATEFHRGIPSAQNNEIYGWIMPCNTETVLPGNLTFTIGGVDFAVPVKNLMREPVKGLDGWCFSAVTSGASNFIILGDVFLRSNYVVFDRRNARVGIAPSKH